MIQPNHLENVCSALDTNTSTSVAIKKLSRPFQSEIHAQRAYRELCILDHMGHDNVVGLLNVFTPSPSFEAFSDVYLVTELMTCDLAKLVSVQRQQMAAEGRMDLTQDQIRLYVYQILRGLKYVHSAGMQRNLSENIKDDKILMVDLITITQ